MLDSAIVIPTLTFLAGLLGGHHFALIRDKRKEFNDGSAPLYEKLLKGIRNSNSSLYPSIEQLELFADHFSFYKKRSYLKLVGKLEESLRLDSKAQKFDMEIAEYVLDIDYVSKTHQKAEKVLVYLSRK